MTRVRTRRLEGFGLLAVAGIIGSMLSPVASGAVLATGPSSVHPDFEVGEYYVYDTTGDDFGGVGDIALGPGSGPFGSDVFFTRPGKFSAFNDGNVYQLTDLNNDGDAMDAGENKELATSHSPLSLDFTDDGNLVFLDYPSSSSNRFVYKVSNAIPPIKTQFSTTTIFNPNGIRVLPTDGGGEHVLIYASQAFTQFGGTNDARIFEVPAAGGAPTIFSDGSNIPDGSPAGWWDIGIFGYTPDNWLIVSNSSPVGQNIWLIKDLNADGDANDAGEAKVFLSHPLQEGYQSIAFGLDGVGYLATATKVFRIEDLNNDGDYWDTGTGTFDSGEYLPIVEDIPATIFGFKVSDTGDIFVSAKHATDANLSTIYRIWKKPAVALGGYHPITPCEVLDSSTGSVLAGGSSVSFVAKGPGATGCGIPLAATGVSVLVEATSPLKEGNLRVSPAGVTPSGGIVNFAANGLNNRNTLTVPLSGDLATSLDLSVNSGPGDTSPTTHAKVIVLGWFGVDAQALSYTSVTPCAIGDTRTGEGAVGVFAGPHSDGTNLSFDVVGTFSATQGGGNTDCGIPTTAEALMVNIVGINANGSGDIGAGADSASAIALPLSSVADLSPKMNNSIAVPVPMLNEAISVSVQMEPLKTLEVRLVVLGFYEPADSKSAIYVAVPACTVFDSRPSQGATGSFAGPRVNGMTTLYDVVGSFSADQGGGNTDCNVPKDATAVAINLVAVNASQEGNLRATPSGTIASGGVLNFGALIPKMNNSNTVVISVSAGGLLDVSANGGAGPISDVRGVVVGYMVSAGVVP